MIDLWLLTYLIGACVWFVFFLAICEDASADFVWCIVGGVLWPFMVLVMIGLYLRKFTKP